MALQNIRTDALGNATVIDLDTAVSGSITAAAQAITLNLSGDSAYALEVQGTFVGTLQIERTVDGTTWRPVNGALTGVGTLVQSLTAPGSLQGHSGPSLAIRLIATAWTSGTATVMLRAGVGSGAMFMVAPLPAGGNVIGAANVNTANASATTALHTANVTTGLTVGSNLPITGYGTSVIKVTGTFVGSMAFKVSQDGGTSWDNISGTQVGGGDIFTSATLPGSYRFTVAGFDLLRVEVTLTSGSITINGKSSNAVNASKIVKLATSGLVIGALAAGTNTIGTVLLPRPSGGTAVTVAASATVITLLAANAARSGATFYSAPGSAILFLKLGAAASATSYNIQIAAGGYYEVPAGYSGIVTGLSATATGSTLVGEIS